MVEVKDLLYGVGGGAIASLAELGGVKLGESIPSLPVPGILAEGIVTGVEVGVGEWLDNESLRNLSYGSIGKVAGDIVTYLTTMMKK